MTKALKNHIKSIKCREILNAIQERKRCNRLVIIPWQKTIPFQELSGDHFGVDVKRNGDHFGVDLRSFQGWGSFRGRDHFGGCTAAPVVFRVWAMVLTQVSYWAFSQLSSFSRLVLSGLSDPTVGSLKTIAKLFFRICFAYLAVIKSSVNISGP